MSKKLSTIWDADPHTKAKLTILKSYLDAWFRILGMKRKDQTILYVDGFAGPGLYNNHEEGSPLAAVRAAKDTIHHLGESFIAAGIECAFIEKDQKRFAILSDTLSSFHDQAKLTIRTFNLEFVDGIKEVRAAVPAPFKGEGPLFVFADPFGGTGIPFASFAACMEGNTSELLINLDADGIGRIFKADNPKREEQLTELFGDESWRTRLKSGAAMGPLSLEILNLYKERLQTIPGVRYVWSFAMRGKHDAINYHLVFASKHPLGLEKMKEAMRSIDQTGTYSFSDAHADQHALFKDDNEVHYAGLLWQQFKDQNISYGVVAHFALTETPFLNAKAMLRLLEQEGKVEPMVRPGTSRKKGDFAEEKIESLWFCQPPIKAQQQSFF